MAEQSNSPSAQGGLYSCDDLNAIIDAIAGARKRELGPLTDVERRTIIEQAQLIGAFYEWNDFERKSHRPRSERINELERLEQAATALANSKEANKLAKVVASLDRQTYFLLRSHNAPNRCNMGTVVGASFWVPESDTIDELPGRIGELAKTVRAAIDALEATPADRTGPKYNQAIETLARDIAPLYEALTGRKPGAFYSEHKAHRTGPFVRVLHAFLRPYGTPRTEAQLGSLAARLFTNRPN